MDFEIKKNVRSAFMHPGDYEVWINGIGANRENFEDTRKGPDDYSQQFTGWTIGEDDLTPVKARIEEMVEAPRTEATDQIYTSFADIDNTSMDRKYVRVFVYGEFHENDWELVQRWFLELTDTRLSSVSEHTQSVSCHLGISVDLVRTAENIEHPDHHPDAPFLEFGFDTFLMERRHYQSGSRIVLFPSGLILFGIIKGDSRDEENRNELIRICDKIRESIIQP
jgi:hypothetical protein